MKGAKIGHVSRVHKQIKVADVVDTHMKQRVVIAILTADEASPTEIPRDLKCVYGKHAVVNTVRLWVNIMAPCFGKRSGTFCGLPEERQRNKLGAVRGNFRRTATRHPQSSP